MKILLIRPRSGVVSTPIPLGLLYIASSLKNNNKSDGIKVIDANLRKMPLSSIEEEIRLYSPDVVGISSMTVEGVEAHQIAALAKKGGKSIYVVMGGAYPSSDPIGVLSDKNIDYAVMGEGEITAVKLVKAIGGDGNIEDINSIGYRRREKILINPPGKIIEDVDAIPFPAWDLIDMEGYLSKWRSTFNIMQVSKRCVPIHSSRGCPYHCIYCHNVFGKRFHPRSPENVLREIEQLVEKYKIEEIEFFDDVFNFDLPRAKEILKLIAEKFNLNVCLPNGIRGDLVDEEFLDIAKKAGVYRICYGIESASERIQREIKKNLKLEKLKKAIDSTVKKKISAHGFFMLGFPGETIEDLKTTYEFAVKSSLHTAGFYFFTPYPNAGKERRIEVEDYDPSIPKLKSISHLVINCSKVDDKRLIRMKRKMYIRFYFSLKRIILNLKILPKNMMSILNIFNIIKLMIREPITF